MSHLDPAAESPRPDDRQRADDPPPFDPVRDADAIHELRSILPPEPPPWATPMRFTTPEERAAGMPVAVPANEPMAPRSGAGRPPVLDADKQRQVCLLLAAGCSRDQAARYVGCGRATIYRTARRDPRFACGLEQAEISRQYSQLQNVRRAAGHQWRAAAWLLERYDPERFQPSRRDRYTTREVVSLVRAICAELIEHNVSPLLREQAGRRVQQLVNGLDCPGGIARRLLADAKQTVKAQ